MGITKLVKTDYGFDDTGATSNTSKYFGLTKPDMVGQDFVVLNYNSGTYKFTGFSSPVGVPNCGDLTINLGTATLNDGGVAGSGGDGNGPAFLWSSGHEAQIGIDATSNTPAGFSTAGGKSARIQTASIGATSVTLTSASAGAAHISRFSVGQWMMVAGWATQGVWPGGYSFPNNFHWHDYVKITSIVGNTIFFAGQPLSNYYDQNWPELNRGTEYEIEAAGPATIFAMSLDWDGTTTVNNGTVDVSAVGGTFMNNCRRAFVANNVAQLGKTFYPSMNKTYTAIGCNVPNVLVEHDKNIDLADIQGGTYRLWKVQSSSTKLLKIDGATITQAVQGTGRAAEFTNDTIQGPLSIGPLAYGRGDTFRCVNTSISGAITGQGILVKGTRFQDQGLQDCIFMNNGVITVPMCLADDLLSYLMPDPSGRHVLFWSGNNGTFASFKVLSATGDLWPAADIQTASIGITTTSGSKTLVTDTPLFSPSDVGKIVLLPGTMAGTGTGFTDCTISNASPGVVTQSNHGRVLNDPVRFQASSGVLPTGISAGGTYYVTSTSLTSSTYTVSATVGGAAINTSGGSGTVQASYSGNIYTFIASYVNSTTVTLNDFLTNFSMTSVVRNLQWGTCNAYIQTDQSGGLPNSSLLPVTGKLTIRVPSARSVYFENVTGTDLAVDLSQPAARNRPFGSYTKRSYDGQTNFSGVTSPQVTMLGNIVSLKVNVITPYTGVSSLNMTFNLRRMVGDTQTGTYVNYSGVINLKVAGERVMLPNGVTTGAQTGDSSLNMPATGWLCDGMGTTMSRNITGESAATAPLYTVELITDQGFPTQPVAVAPLRLRLRAA